MVYLRGATFLKAFCHFFPRRTELRISQVITHPLIFARFYLLFYMTWCKTTGQLSRNNPRLRRYLSSDCFRGKETKPAEKSQLKCFIFSSLLFYMEERQTRFVESNNGDINKLVTNAVPESTKKSTKYAVNASLKVKKVTSRLSDLVLRKFKLSYFVK